MHSREHERLGLIESRATTTTTAAGTTGTVTGTVTAQRHGDHRLDRPAYSDQSRPAGPDGSSPIISRGGGGLPSSEAAREEYPPRPLVDGAGGGGGSSPERLQLRRALATGSLSAGAQ